MQHAQHFDLKLFSLDIVSNYRKVEIRNSAKNFHTLYPGEPSVSILCHFVLHCVLSPMSCVPSPVSCVYKHPEKQGFLNHMRKSVFIIDL